MKRLVILGAGESGAGTAILGQAVGYEVFVSDMGTIKEQYKSLMDAHGVPYEEGQHTSELILNATEVVKSPGIPLTAPIVAALMEQGTPILSEIEFAARYTNAKFVCITGSNGKTTTTSLIYDIFTRAGMNVGLAGNIGKSLALQVAEELATPAAKQAKQRWYVLELSSFQLDNMYDFRANVAIVMNITPDHLDRYDYCFQNYANAKMRIAQNQTPEDAFIYWTGCPVVSREVAARTLGATLYPFDATTPLPVADDKIAIRGVHNRLNATAATLAARCAGISDAVIADSLRLFAGVEHRLQHVADVHGVEWINDSKATNVDSCFYALGAMTRPTVLILGGKDKGNDYSQIDELVKAKCKALVFMGLHNEKLNEHFGSFGLPIYDTCSLDEAMRACQEAAQPGDVVLLSPCCASFDLFRSYEDRGEQFMHKIHELC